MTVWPSSNRSRALASVSRAAWTALRPASLVLSAALLASRFSFFLSIVMSSVPSVLRTWNTPPMASAKDAVDKGKELIRDAGEKIEEFGEQPAPEPDGSAAPGQGPDS